jgi:hypothetical protein
MVTSGGFTMVKILMSRMEGKEGKGGGESKRSRQN